MVFHNFLKMSQGLLASIVVTTSLTFLLFTIFGTRYHLMGL